MSDRFSEAGEKFAELVRIMARLRGPNGCPWDAEQTPQTLKSYVLEESYEVLDAIDRQDWPGLAEELGDLLLQPVFLAEIAESFTISDSLDAINRKLVRRHPHVFGDATADTAEAVTERWDEIKKQEKSARPTSILDQVPRNLPALVEAEKISKKAAKLGFEWPSIDGVLEKLQEEAAELASARESADAVEMEHEIGDLLFTIVNLARFLKMDPEQALRKTNARFRHRFAFVEREIDANTPLERMEALWQQAKLTEPRP